MVLGAPFGSAEAEVVKRLLLRLAQFSNQQVDENDNALVSRTEDPGSLVGPSSTQQPSAFSTTGDKVTLLTPRGSVVLHEGIG